MAVAATERLGGVIKGLATTFKYVFRRPITVQFPEERVQVSPRYKGRHRLLRYPNGLERCIGCELCAAACPAQAIYVEAAENDPNDRKSPGERYARRYEINLLRCIFCGYCQEACPTEAIVLGPEYEISGYSRDAFIVTKDQLLVPLPKVQR
jgi:NADH-quinone oxidoreductase subunit I